MKKLKEISPHVLLAAVFMLSISLFLLVELFPSWLYRTMDIASYLVFHNITEFFSIMVSLAIFSVGWFTFDQSRNRHALFLGCAFLAIGLMDFMHTFGYAGMPAFITPNSPLKSTQFWIAVRMYSALAFLISGYVQPESSGRLLSKYFLLASAVAVSGAVFVGVTFFPSDLPATIIEGKGVTPFKRYCEYLTILLFALSIPVYWRRYADTGKRQFIYYLAAFIICIFSELAFSGYKSVFDSYNVLGHIYKVIAFALIYQGIFIAAVRFPYLELVAKSEDLRIESDERQRAGNELRLHSEILKNMAEGVYLVRVHDEVIVYANPRFEQMFGYDPGELVGKHVSIVNAPDGKNPEAVAAEIIDSLARVSTWSGEVLNIRKDGTAFWCYATVSTFDHPQYGQVWVTVHEDITERKRGEEALQRERSLLRCIIDYTSDLIFIKDRDGVYLGCNKASEKFVGLPESEQIGKTDFDFFDNEMARHIQEDDRQVTVEGKTLRTEEWVTYPDGSRVLLDTLKAPFYGPDGEIKGLVGSCRDITERKRAEEQLARLNAKLEQRISKRTALLLRKTVELEQANERLKEVDRLKSSFIASMSHELRTPLNAVIGFSSVLLDEWLGTVNVEQKQNLMSILSSGRHLLNMINDILDVTQIEAGTITPVIEEFDLHDLLAEAKSEVMAAILEKGLELRSELLQQQMRTDRQRLLQCVLNILRNAAKFTDKGSVTLEARIVPSSGETPEGEMVEIAVSDTGIGIGEEDQSRIFLPFHRVVTLGRTIVPGTGLGLFLTRKIATEILKGDLLVSSEYGKGSRFSLRIPVRLS